MYTNIFDYINKKYVFNFFIGGRGIGKTYSVLKGIYEKEIPFIYLRYTNVELDIAINADMFKLYGDKISYNRIEQGFYAFQIDKKLIGYGMSLTTFRSKRGIDFSNIKLIFFDEFIPERGARKVISYVGDTFLNMYETVNRNREFNKEDPVLMIACANSNDIANPLMLDLGLTKIAEDMIRNDLEFYHDYKRSMQLGILKSNPDFIDKKSKTVLYKFATKDFADMSLNNIFAYNDFGNVKQKSLKGYKPIFSIKDNFTFYQQKGSKLYYLYPNIIANEVYDINNDIELQKLKNKYLIFLESQYYNNRIKFASYEIKQLFIDLFIKLR